LGWVMISALLGAEDYTPNFCPERPPDVKDGKRTGCGVLLSVILRCQAASAAVRV